MPKVQEMIDFRVVDVQTAAADGLAPTQIQLAVLVFLDPPRDLPAQVTELGDTGADFAFVTADLALGFHGRVLAAFVLFRVFDIAKPWPCRQLEKLPGGLGIAADDAMAGVYAHLALRIGVFAWGAAVS